MRLVRVNPACTRLDIVTRVRTISTCIIHSYHPPVPLAERRLLLLQVVGIMKNNVEKVLERDEKLGQLEDKSGASPFPNPINVP